MYKKVITRVLSVATALVMLVCGLMPASVFAEQKEPFKEMKLPGDVWACDFDKGDKSVSYYTSSTGGTSSYRTGVDMRLFDQSYGVGTAFVQGDWANYTVMVEKSGFYVPTIYYATPEPNVSFSLEAEENSQTINLDTTQDYTTAMSYVADNFYLEAGKHTLKIRWMSGGVTFYKISFGLAGSGTSGNIKTEGSYRTHILPTKIEAEDFDLGKDGNVSLDDKNSGGKYRKNEGIDIYSGGSGYYITLAAGESTKYSFDVPASGAYALKLSANGSSEVNIYVDDFKMPITAKVNGAGVFTENAVESIYFTEGEHFIRIAPKSDVSLDWLKLVSSKESGINPEELTAERAAEEEAKKTEQHPVYKELYMSPEGNDEADGSEAAPFKTLDRVREEIAKINDDMDGDIVVNILPGEYQIDTTQVFTKEHSGKNGYNVVLRGTNIFDKPVFSGGTKITGWEKHTDYIWKAPYDGEADIRNLYVNGYMAQRARSKYRYRPTENYTAEDSSNVNDGVAITQINFPTEFARPEDLELCWQNAWAFNITPVKDVEFRNEMVYFIMDQPYYNQARTKIAISQAPGAFRRFHIQNAMELLDEPGEFYYNREEKVIYYYPFIKEDLTESETVVGTTDLMFSVQGEENGDKVENIVFDNISIKYGSWNEVNTTGLIYAQADKVVNAPYSDEGKGGKMIPAQLDIKDANGIQVKNCEFSCLGSSAVAMSEGVTNSKVIGNSIHDISGSGIVVGHWDHNANHGAFSNIEGQCSNIDIENNALVRIAYEFKGCCGISVYYEKNINILHNYLKDTAYSGMTIGWGWGEAADFGNIKISYNYIEDPMIPPVLDGGHIYTLGPLKNSEISYNYLHKATGLYGGIYPDSGSAYLQIHHNVVDEGPHWFFGGLYETHDLNAYSNYSDTETYYDYGATDEYPGENTVEQATIVKDGNWPEEAKEIMAGAGLEENYTRLLSGLDYPAWRTDFVKNAPSDNFILPDNAKYEAEDYNEGGEGVGYHKLTKGDNQVYRPGDVVIFHQEDTGDIVIGGTYDGEWLAYDIDIPEDGTYELIVCGANSQYISHSPEPYANVYIDGELVIEHQPITQTENWALNIENNFGELELKKGKHLIKFEFVENGFSFDWFKFQDIRTKGLPITTSPYYDEISFVYENPFYDTVNHWAEESITLMAHKGIINGVGDDMFAPEKGLTKEEAMLLVMRAAKISDEASKEEAVKSGLIKQPENWSNFITREEFTAAVVRAYEIKAGEAEKAAGGAYADESDISPEFYGEVMKARNLSIIAGDDAGRFNPLKGLSRAEAATIVYRLLNLIEA